MLATFRVVQPDNRLGCRHVWPCSYPCGQAVVQSHQHPMLGFPSRLFSIQRRKNQKSFLHFLQIIKTPILYYLTYYFIYTFWLVVCVGNTSYKLPTFPTPWMDTKKPERIRHLLTHWEIRIMQHPYYLQSGKRFFCWYHAFPQWLPLKEHLLSHQL